MHVISRHRGVFETVKMVLVFVVVTLRKKPFTGEYMQLATDDLARMGVQK